MATFDQKVEALRRLRDRRQLRKGAETAAVGYPPEADVCSAPAPAAPCLDQELQEADALFCLGHCRERGLHGYAPDSTAAALLYASAATAGHAVAQWRLGELYEFGRGVEQDDTTAVKWYRRAADQGHAHAQSGLALLLEAGRANSDDPSGDASEEALRWHLAAAEQDHALSQYCAACLLLQGRGCGDSEGRTLAEAAEEAQRWLRRSAAANFGPALEALVESCVGDEGLASRDAVESQLLIDEAEELDSESPLLALASRVAAQLKHLDDDAAERMLDELLVDDASLPDASDSDSERDGDYGRLRGG